MNSDSEILSSVSPVVPAAGNRQGHPNAERWERAVKAARLRGGLVGDLLSEETRLPGMKVLDAGCGIGGTSAVLHERGCSVIAADINPDRLHSRHIVHSGIPVLRADLNSLPLADSSIDIVVLQDVIEHVSNPEVVLREAHRLLKPGGFCYLSTPNRFSVINLLADPHFGLPLVSLMNRRQLQAVLRRLRSGDAERRDLAQLLSPGKLRILLGQADLKWRFRNRSVARMLLSEPENIVWSDFHLRAIRLLRRTGALRYLTSLVNDREGLFNSLLNPTWYLMARKDKS